MYIYIHIDIYRGYVGLYKHDGRENGNYCLEGRDIGPIMEELGLYRDL